MPEEVIDPAAPKEGDTAKTFTQEQVDKMIGDRLARAKTAPPADYADLQAAAKKLQELEAAQLTETEKLQKAQAAAEARATEAETKLRDATKRNAVYAAAQRAGAIDPDAVFALLDQSAVTVGDDGQLTGVDEAVKALLDNKQYLVGKSSPVTPGAADGGPRGKPAGSITRDQLSTMTSQQINDARLKGELDHLLKG